jgi:hypothetical protein
MGRFHTNLLGKVFGKLTVVAFDSIDSGGNAKWLCQCECGVDCIKWLSDLRGSSKREGTSSCVSCAQTKERCKRGHEFTPENTYIPTDGTRRTCRTCKRVGDKKLQKQHNQYLRDNPEKRRAYQNTRRSKQMGAGGSFTPEEWLLLCKKYHHKCLRCSKRRKLTADHIVPVSKGGTSYIANIQPLCKPCNSWKHTKFIDFRRKEIKSCH